MLLQIVLCENNIYSQGHMNDTLTHELVHTYDYCRAHLDWNNLDHLACTEVGHLACTDNIACTEVVY